MTTPSTSTGALEYRTASKQPWVVLRFEALSIDFFVAAQEIRAFHDTAKECSNPAWAAVRLIYGVWPLLPSLRSNPTLLGTVLDLREVCSVLKLNRKQLNEHLGAVTWWWLRAKEKSDRGSVIDSAAIFTK